MKPAIVVADTSPLIALLSMRWDFGMGGYHKTPDKDFYETHFFGKFRELK